MRVNFSHLLQFLLGQLARDRCFPAVLLGIAGASIRSVAIIPAIVLLFSKEDPKDLPVPLSIVQTSRALLLSAYHQAHWRSGARKSVSYLLERGAPA